MTWIHIDALYTMTRINIQLISAMHERDTESPMGGVSGVRLMGVAQK